MKTIIFSILLTFSCGVVFAGDPPDTPPADDTTLHTSGGDTDGCAGNPNCLDSNDSGTLDVGDDVPDSNNAPKK